MGYPTMHLSPHTSSKSPECFPDSQITTTKSLLVCFFALPFPPALGVCGKWRQNTIDYIWRIASFSRSINSTNLFTLWKVLKALNGYCIWHILLWHMRKVVVFLPEKLLFFYKVKYVTWQLAYTTHCQLNLSNMWHSGKACWQTTKTEFFLPVIYLDASKFTMWRVFPGYILQHSSDMISILLIYTHDKWSFIILHLDHLIPYTLNHPYWCFFATFSRDILLFLSSSSCFIFCFLDRCSSLKLHFTHQRQDIT